jgi:hypothetical protein
MLTYDMDRIFLDDDGSLESDESYFAPGMLEAYPHLWAERNDLPEDFSDAEELTLP